MLFYEKQKFRVLQYFNRVSYFILRGWSLTFLIYLKQGVSMKSYKHRIIQQGSFWYIYYMKDIRLKSDYQVKFKEWIGIK